MWAFAAGQGSLNADIMYFGIKTYLDHICADCYYRTIGKDH